MPQDPPKDTPFWEKAKKRALLRRKGPLMVIDPKTARYRRAYGIDSTTGQPRFEEPKVEKATQETMGSIRIRMRKGK